MIYKNILQHKRIFLVYVRSNHYINILMDNTTLSREPHIMQPTSSMNQIKRVFQTQVKWTRVLKELSDLNLLEESPIFQITPIGLRIPITHDFKSSIYRFEIRIDNNYPFSKPQIHSLDNVWRYAEARDLLELGLEQGTEWNSGMTFMDLKLLIPKIVQHLFSNQMQVGKYHLFEKYFKQQLILKGLQLFHVVETKKKLMVKSRKDKVIAFGKKVFLKFEVVNDFLILDTNIFRSDIEEVKRDGNLNSLKIYYTRFGCDTQQHFTIQKGEGSLDKILYNLNPIDWIQGQIDKQECNKEPQQVAGNLSTLISFYSDKNKSKSQKYLHKLKRMMSREEQQQQQLKQT